MLMKRWIITALLILVATTAAAAPSGAHRPAQQTCGATYTVQEGDTLYSIGQRCRISYVVLMGINVQLSDPDKLWPGMVIRLRAEAPLPTPQVEEPPVPDEPGDRVYTARRGDSLARIALYFNTTVEELLALNPEIPESQIIFAGQEILLPPEALAEEGWVGVSKLSALRGEAVRVNAAGFPPNAPVDVRLRLDEPGESDFILAGEGQTNARGELEMEIRMPFTARQRQVWLVEVVATEVSPAVLARSAGITIR